MERERYPHVVLPDIRMPDVDGLTVLQRLRTLESPPTVAMLTTFDTHEYVLTALNSGAAGCLLKDTEPGQLARLVRGLAAGAVVMSPQVTRTLLTARPTGRSDDEGAARVRRLGDRQRETLVLVAESLSNPDIQDGPDSQQESGE